MLKTREAAEYLGISRFYLRNLRHLQHNHDGPAYTLGQWRNQTTYFYSIAELDKWKLTHKWRRTKSRGSGTA